VSVLGRTAGILVLILKLFSMHQWSAVGRALLLEFLSNSPLDELKDVLFSVAAGQEDSLLEFLVEVTLSVELEPGWIGAHVDSEENNTEYDQMFESNHGS